MKKVILTLFILSSMAIFANDEIISELKGLNTEYEDLVKEEEAKGYQVEMTAEEAKAEKEKLANMTEDEKLMYKVDKAKEKIDNMLDIAKKARQEEIDVEETKSQVEEALKNITEEK